VRVVYDSHEVQVHRHRKSGLLRMLIEHHHEQRALEVATSVRTVNLAVARAMQQLHPWLSEPPDVVLNDFFAHRPVGIANAATRPTLVYVGRAVKGRQLERIARACEGAPFEVRGFLLAGAVAPAGSDPNHWLAAGDDYEDSLAALMTRQRCIMWCCLETRALSYRLATPNKLFQALALGMPVLASPGTYLADLVAEHGIGAIDDGDLRKLAERVQSKEYVDWVGNVSWFRASIRAGTTRL